MYYCVLSHFLLVGMDLDDPSTGASTACGCEAHCQKANFDFVHPNALYAPVISVVNSENLEDSIIVYCVATPAFLSN